MHSKTKYFLVQSIECIFNLSSTFKWNNGTHCTVRSPTAHSGVIGLNVTATVVMNCVQSRLATSAFSIDQFDLCIGYALCSTIMAFSACACIQRIAILVHRLPYSEIDWRRAVDECTARIKIEKNSFISVITNRPISMPYSIKTNWASEKIKWNCNSFCLLAANEARACVCICLCVMSYVCSTDQSQGSCCTVIAHALLHYV